MALIRKKEVREAPYNIYLLCVVTLIGVTLPETKIEKRVETDLRTRLAAVRELKEAFGIDIQKITDFSEPPRNRTTVAKVLSGADERY